MDAPATNKPRRRLFGRYYWRLGAALFVLGVAVIVSAPYLIASQALRSYVLDTLFADVHGKVTAGSISLGWFTPPHVEDIEVRSLDGEPVLEIAALRLHQPLWRLIADSQQIGRVDVEQPHATFIRTANGSNFAETFPPRPHPSPQNWQGKLASVVINQGMFTWRVAGTDHVWNVSGLKFAAGLQPDWLSPSGRSEFYIEPGNVLENYELTPGMCNDVLKFVAPVLAKVSTTQGEISIVLGGGRIPVLEPKAATLTGALVLHSVDVGGGAIVKELAAFLKLPEVIHLARDSTVKFEMANGRVHHSGLEFGLENVRVSTSGYVNLDESLDLVAEVRFSFPDSVTAEQPIRRSLNGKVLRLPIKGTLHEPKINWSAVGQGKNLLADAMQLLGSAAAGNAAAGNGNNADAVAEPTAAQRALEQLTKSGVLTDGHTAPEQPTVDLPTAAVDVLKEMLERRRERQRAAAEEAARNPPPTNVPPPGEPPPPQPRRRLLGRAVERLIDATKPPPGQPAPEQPAPAPAPQP